MISGILIGLLLGTGQAEAADHVWKRLRYQGGTIEAKVNPFDWNTALTTSGTRMQFVFAGQKTVMIDAADVTSLSYGQMAYRRVADMATLSVLLTPVALFGILHQSKDHLVSIQFKSSDGRPCAVLLAVHKDAYRDLLVNLSILTKKPVENWR